MRLAALWLAGGDVERGWDGGVGRMRRGGATRVRPWRSGTAGGRAASTTLVAGAGPPTMGCGGVLVMVIIVKVFLYV
jgi:hypothetical protein